MPYDVTYAFTSLAANEDDFTWDGPDVDVLSPENTDGAWCWTATGSTSSSTGPPTGTACVYTETSSPVTVDDEFTMTLAGANEIDASLYALYVEFDTSTQGNTDGELIFEAFDGSTWNLIDSWGGDAVTTMTAQGPYDLSAYNNSDFSIRFRVIVGSASQTYHNDFAVTNINIYGEDVAATEPVITDVGTDEDIAIGETGVTVTGTNFEAEGANSRVRINSDSDGTGTDQAQTDTSWAATSIDFTASLGSLSYGSNYLFVRNQSLDENAVGFLVNLYQALSTSSLNDDTFYSGQTGIELNGAGFGASQGTSKIYLADSSDGSGVNVEQTVTAWANDKVTFTVAPGTLGLGTVYVIVGRNQSSLGDSSERLTNAQTATLGINPSLPFTYGTYTWDTQTSGDEDDWLFTGPQAGTGLSPANTAGRWSWDEDATTSTDVGPDHGQGGNPDGYIYTEMSSQVIGDEWFLELDKNLNASTHGLEFDFYWCARGDDAEPVIQLQSNENGAGWVNRGTATGFGDVTIPATGGATEWNRKTVDLAGLVSDSSTRLRLHITCNGATQWHNDVGFDTITITGTPLTTDPNITDVGTDEDIAIGETGVAVTGTNFEAEGANSRVRINSASDGLGTDQVQTDTSWAATSIDFTASLGSLSYGSNYLFVRNQSLDENATGFLVNLYQALSTSSLNDDTFYSGQTGIELNGAGFGASQGASKIYLADSSDGSGVNVEQTVTAWANDKVTFTAVRGALSLGTVYVIVGRDQSSLGDSSERLTNAQTATLGAVPVIPVITNVGDEDFVENETDVLVEGTGFGASQGSGKCQMCPTSVYSAGSAIDQSVNTWNDTGVNIDIARGSLSIGINYLFVENDGGIRNATGYAVNINAAASSDGLYQTTNLQSTVTSKGLVLTAFLISDE